MNMRLMGVTSISQLKPSMVDIGALNLHSNNVPKNYLQESAYEKMTAVKVLKAKL